MRHWFDINITYCLKWCIVVRGSMNMTTCLTQGPGHGECYIVLNQKQLPVTTASKNLPNNLKSNLPHSKFLRPGDLRSNPWTLQHGSPSRQQNTTAWPPPQHHRFHIYPSSNAWWLRSCWGPQPLPDKNMAFIQSKWKHLRLVNSGNIHSLSVWKVRQGQCQSMSGSVCQVQATSGQLMSNGFTGLGPFIAAVIVRQIDVNDRVV